jgi:lysozyme
MNDHIHQPSAACLDLIKRSEGVRLSAYPDPGTGGDPWTIGYGHTGPEVHRGLVWTQAQADAALALDVARFADKVEKLIGDAATTQGEFDALVSFAFNVGAGNLASSTLLRKHKAGDKAGAAAEFGKWTHAAGRVLPGLVTRRAAEAALYRGAA